MEVHILLDKFIPNRRGDFGRFEEDISIRSMFGWNVWPVEKEDPREQLTRRLATFE